MPSGGIPSAEIAPLSVSADEYAVTRMWGWSWLVRSVSSIFVGFVDSLSNTNHVLGNLVMDGNQNTFYAGAMNFSPRQAVQITRFYSLPVGSGTLQTAVRPVRFVKTIEGGPSAIVDRFFAVVPDDQGNLRRTQFYSNTHNNSYSRTSNLAVMTDIGGQVRALALLRNDNFTAAYPYLAQKVWSCEKPIFDPATFQVNCTGGKYSTPIPMKAGSLRLPELNQPVFGTYYEGPGYNYGYHLFVTEQGGNAWQIQVYGPSGTSVWIQDLPLPLGQNVYHTLEMSSRGRLIAVENNRISVFDMPVGVGLFKKVVADASTFGALGRRFSNISFAKNSVSLEVVQDFQIAARVNIDDCSGASGCQTHQLATIFASDLRYGGRWFPTRLVYHGEANAAAQGILHSAAIHRQDWNKGDLYYSADGSNGGANLYRASCAWW